MPKKRARRSDSKDLQKTKRSKGKAPPDATHFNFNNSDDEILSESSDEELRVEGSGSGMKGDDFFKMTVSTMMPGKRHKKTHTIGKNHC